MASDRYVVTSTGTKNGAPYATLAKIVEGVKKDGDRYGFINTDMTIREQELLTVGQIFEYATARVSTAPKSAEAAGSHTRASASGFGSAIKG